MYISSRLNVARVRLPVINTASPGLPNMILFFFPHRRSIELHCIIILLHTTTLRSPMGFI